jgi:peptidoglycan-N-acetylglucosamine deacetylase
LRNWTPLCLAVCILCGGCRAAPKSAEKPAPTPEPSAYTAPVPEMVPSVRPQADPGPAVDLPPPPVEPSEAPTQAPTPEVVPSPSRVPPKPSSPPPASKKDKPAAKQAAKANKGGEQQKSGGAAAGKGGKSSSLTELRRKYADSFIFQGSSGKKQIALTFDDAPDTNYTPKVLDILKRNNVKATFFVVGYRAEEHPDMVRRIVREGHVVGNHTYGHAQLKKLSQDKFIQEIDKTEKILSPLTGYAPRLVRPPYGAVNDAELEWLKGEGYLTVNWNVDPEDWKGTPGSEVLKRSISAAGPGSIILMHSATGQGGSLQGTIDALPGLIEALRGKGYDLVTLSELLQTKKSK